MRVYVELRDHDGALVGVDMWGAVTDVGYSGAENALTVNGSDGEGIRQKWYGSGTYAAVAMFPAGAEDFSMWPKDAKRVTCAMPAPTETPTKKRTLTIRELREYLDVCEVAATEDIEPPITNEEYASIAIGVRFHDEEGVSIGGLASVGIEDDCGGDVIMLMLDVEQTLDPTIDPVKLSSARQLAAAIAGGSIPRTGVKLTERGALAVTTSLVMRLRERLTNCHSGADEQLRSEVDAILPTLQRMAGLAS